MWFIKRNFISFIEEEKFKLLKEVFKKDKIIEKETKEFEKKEELDSFVKEELDEIPQTYISTITFTLNQGVMDSCSKQKYLEHEIDYDNVKIVCLGNYSFYISLFDLQKIRKDYPYLDFIYPPFAIIDYLAKERENIFYVLIFEKYLVVLAYEKWIPIFSDIIETKESEENLENVEDIEDIEDIEEIDTIDDLSEDITEDIDAIDEEELEEKLEEIENKATGIEAKILQFIQDSLKEYYANYSSDFIEKIILFDTIGIDEKIANIIEEEVLIECTYKKIDALEIINRISRESVL